jgi:hypothetical protein
LSSLEIIDKLASGNISAKLGRKSKNRKKDKRRNGWSRKRKTGMIFSTTTCWPRKISGRF